MIAIDISYAILVLILIVLGLAIIFGLLRVINMAHGEKVMLGAYSVWFAEQQGWPFWLGVFMALAVTAVVGAIVYQLVIARIRARLLDTILATWGVSIVLKQVISLAFGAAGQHVSTPVDQTVLLFGQPYPVYRLLVMLVSVVTVIGIYRLFFKTRFGMRARAVMNNPALAACVGIHRARLNLLSFVIGAMTAGLAGAMIAPLISISPLMGDDYLIPAFLSVLVGGLGSIVAPIFGAGVIAGIESAATRFYDPVIAQIVMLVVAVILLKLFPKGIFTHKR
ncbi:MAG: branched-chain amino acid ABC transporter permease [Gammaproteobacteria bacterium]|nr:MAG: branched-chain amino acid ABC transporter permease [Gammaproteobacteria bacterium]